MKRFLSMILTAMLLCAALPQLASAEETVNLYWDDGRMATVPVSIADQCRADGWQDSFPYCGKTIWVHRSVFWSNFTDIYGTEVYKLYTYANLPVYIQATIVWYDDQDFSYLGGYQKQLKTLIVDYNGSQLKMAMGDFLRGRDIYNNYQTIYWEDPKVLNGMSDESWNRLQRNEFWIGMPKNEFLLLKGVRPTVINYSNYGYGELEQWVYRSSGTYYYFRDGVLTGWQV